MPTSSDNYKDILRHMQKCRAVGTMVVPEWKSAPFWPLVHAALEGAHRQLGKPTVKKEPVTPEMLQNLVEKFGGKNASLADLHRLSICIWGMLDSYGMMRWLV